MNAIPSPFVAMRRACEEVVRTYWQLFPDDEVLAAGLAAELAPYAEGIRRLFSELEKLERSVGVTVVTIWPGPPPATWQGLPVWPGTSVKEASEP